MLGGGALKVEIFDGRDTLLFVGRIPQSPVLFRFRNPIIIIFA